jgi:hypothetical protein
VSSDGEVCLVDVVWRNGPLACIALHKNQKGGHVAAYLYAILNLADFFQSFLVYIKIGVHVLYVVLVFQGFQQANHGVGG